MKSLAFHKASKPSRIYSSPVAQSFFETQRRIEFKLDMILTHFMGSTVVDRQTYEDVMKEFVQGNRKPFDEYFKNGGKVPKKEIPG